MEGKVALIAGSSGLVGNELLQFLLNSQEYKKVYAIVRSPLEVDHPKLIEVVCDFDNLEEVEFCFNADDVFCCLGTTIKKAKTKQVMYKIDVEFPLAIAKLSKARGVTHFLVVSSMNANATSPLWYPKIKGELEEMLRAIPFQTLSIFRPSLLLGNRKEFRLAESTASKIFHLLSPLMKDSWKSRLAIKAKTVAQAMYEIAQMEKKGVSIYGATAIEEIAGQKK